MPDMSGVDLAKLIKLEFPSLPLIAVSSIESYVDITNFECIIQKPVPRTRLISAIENVLQTDDACLVSTDSSGSFSGPEDRKHLNIIVCEDVAYNLSMLVSMLESIGYTHIDTANSGLEAIKLLRSRKYDIMLLDLKMPDVDGYGVLHFVREHNITIETIIVTASILDNDRMRCKDNGAHYFINKPVDLRQLRSVMNRASQNI